MYVGSLCASLGWSLHNDYGCGLIYFSSIFLNVKYYCFSSGSLEGNLPKWNTWAILSSQSTRHISTKHTIRICMYVQMFVHITSIFKCVGVWVCVTRVLLKIGNIMKKQIYLFRIFLCLLFLISLNLRIKKIYYCYYI